MKKMKSITFLSLAIMVLSTSCGKVEETVEDTIVEEVVEADIDVEQVEEIQVVPETFDFYDVRENLYTAPFLSNIPMHSYDYSRMDNSKELYTYTDADGKVISKVGIDVSKWQGQIDWQAVADFGVEFVITRLGFRGYGNGELVVDEWYHDYMQGAIDAGLEVGTYFFSQAITQKEAVEEAEFVLEHIKNYNITMPVVFDTEIIEDEEARTHGVDGQVFTDACISFCDVIDEAGYESMIYFNLVWSAFTLDLEQLTKYNKWYADYHDEPQYPYDFQLWQYTETGNIPGVSGNCDINIYFERQ